MKETEFARLMNLSDKCAEKALHYRNTDIDLCLFFSNASEGFKRKALNLNVGQ